MSVFYNIYKKIKILPLKFFVKILPFRLGKPYSPEEF